MVRISHGHRKIKCAFTFPRGPARIRASGVGSKGEVDKLLLARKIRRKLKSVLVLNSYLEVMACSIKAQSALFWINQALFSFAGANLNTVPVLKLSRHGGGHYRAC